MNRRHRLRSVRSEGLGAPRVSLLIRRGTSAPIPGQSDRFGPPDRGSKVPLRDTSGTDAEYPSTSESADTRPKPRGNDGDGRVEDRSNGHLAWPAPRRCANLKRPTRPLAVRRRWESSPFSVVAESNRGRRRDDHSDSSGGAAVERRLTTRTRRPKDRRRFGGGPESCHSPRTF